MKIFMQVSLGVKKSNNLISKIFENLSSKADCVVFELGCAAEFVQLRSFQTVTVTGCH